MKQRLDVLLVERGLAPTRSRAQALIMAGQVLVDGAVVDKAGTLIASAATLELKTRPQYVSRGGDKLASVADKLGLDFSGKVVLDVGASTGGFSDYALQHGASKVYAVDVGRGQLAYTLRQDPRVAVMEQTDIRAVEALPEPVDLAVVDVSFISLRRVLAKVSELIKAGGQVVALVKPQFEAGKAVADKHRGVIDNEGVRQKVLADFRDWVGEDFEIVVEADSGLAGAQGNVERFFLLKR